MLNATKIIQVLNAQHVEYVIVGGLAMVAHGSAYVTVDFDLCYRRTKENMAALVRAIRPVNPELRGAPRGLSFLFDAETLQAGMNFTLDTDLGPTDLLGEISGIGNYDAVLAHSETMEIEGQLVQVLSLDGLIAVKRAAGRTKDQLHLLELEELRKLHRGQ